MVQPKCGNIHDPYPRKLLDALISEHREPARLLELHYWSLEPELLPIIRGCALLPSRTRALLEAFLLKTNPQSVSADMTTDGRMCLTPRAIRPNAKMRG